MEFCAYRRRKGFSHVLSLVSKVTQTYKLNSKPTRKALCRTPSSSDASTAYHTSVNLPTPIAQGRTRVPLTRSKDVGHQCPTCPFTESGRHLLKRVCNISKIIKDGAYHTIFYAVHPKLIRQRVSTSTLPPMSNIKGCPTMLSLPRIFRTLIDRTGILSYYSP